jgi:hypothetical protein
MRCHLMRGYPMRRSLMRGCLVRIAPNHTPEDTRG